ncbi:YbhB/YbcL family Raf kinase inhibitor-like protein [Candidatus Fermentibacteria bacterium]|nr:YbhB/YbcL family Raf kinase inhibitor-like protein [Candidatus Fermentibacteria bacterium]
MRLRSPAFVDGESISGQYGYRRGNVNPPLKIEEVPEGTKSLALIIDDPDAMEPAGKVWDHWVLWNIDPDTREIPEGSVPPGAVQGRTDYGENRYGGPNPPDREHTYRFRAFALDQSLDLPSSAVKADLEKAMNGHVLDQAGMSGTYAPEQGR